MEETARTAAATATGDATKVVASLKFDIGDTVVHPQYGVGHIVRLEDREFHPGNLQRYYEILIQGVSTVWVPVTFTRSGLRTLATRVEIEHCRRVLQSPPERLTEDGRIRQSELLARLRQGTVAVQSEVVRDLSAFVAHKAAYGTITVLLEAIRNVLSQEWAAVEGVTLADANMEINSLLEKSRAAAKRK